MTTCTQLIKKKLDENEGSLDRFLSENDFPLVDRKGATFVFRGDADRVDLQHWIFGLPSSQPFQRLDGTDLWCLHIEMPQESRIEYKINVHADGESRWIRDPLNPVVAHDPFGSNSVYQAKGYSTPEWALPDPEVRQGELMEMSLKSRAFGDTRRVHVYLPARFRRSRSYPLLIVHDGGDYLRYSSLKTVLDNLIQQLEIAPMIVALTGPGERMTEYGADPRQARFLSLELLPRLEELFPLIQDPAGRGIMGASFGAVSSLHAAWTYSGLYGRLLLQSGSFAFADIGAHNRGKEFDPVVEFVNAFRENPRQPASQLFVSCGIYESLIYENRSLVPVLREEGLAVRFVEARDGHNWENWRDRLREGLSWLFPGPLWMVYE